MIRRTLCALLLLIAITCAAAAQSHLPAAFSGDIPYDDMKAMCAACLPAGETLIDFDLQDSFLILLGEDAQGSRRLTIHEFSGGIPRDTTVSSSLPQGAGIDSIHPGEGHVQIEWQEGEASRCAEFYRMSDGRWALDWASDETGVFEAFRACYAGITRGYPDGEGGIPLFGDHPWNDLREVDFSTLPMAFEDAAKQIDPIHWAVVSNPDPRDRLHLRAHHKAGSQSRGKFYNGTPVYIHSITGDWAYVTIGTDGYLSGYMMTKFLAFGQKMNGVSPAFPQLMPADYDRYANGEFTLFKGPDTRDHASCLAPEYRIIGVYEDDYYILLNRDGSTGYAPQEDFFEGNG